MKSNGLTRDFEELLSSELNISEFKDKSFLITGATGLVGSILIKFLLYANEKLNLNASVYALVRNIEKADKIYQGYDTANLQYVVANLGQNNLKLDAELDFIIHLASVTASKQMVSKPVETIKTAVNGTEEILNLAVEKKVKSAVYVSSMEVYGQPEGSRKTSEADLGYVDLTSSRSSYPESKRMCELLCTAYSDEYGLNVKNARLAQTFGAGVLPSENRVFAQFARSVINGEDIVLKTEGKSEGNYIYTADAIKALLFLLLNGEAKQAYNVSNENNHMTIREMAEMVSANFGDNGQKVVIDIPKEDMGYAPEVHMWLDNSKLKSLGWQPTIDMKEAYARLIDWLESSDKKES
ncbi:NAD(P)-dependent oxidoreductase [Limosilactobacillus fermentum]|uniref:NAD-dependent epimerase/dehydratase family protein n=1 Tax=Limosilactobacillus fermentum TaxID=1613 RepID=UPI002F268BA0